MDQERRLGQVAQCSVTLFGRKVLFDKILLTNIPFSLLFARGLRPRGVEVVNAIIEAAKTCVEYDSVIETVWWIRWSKDDIAVWEVLAQGGSSQNARAPKRAASSDYSARPRLRSASSPLVNWS